LKDVPTEGLLKLVLRYGEAMQEEHEPLSMQGEEIAFDLSNMMSTQTWPV